MFVLSFPEKTHTRVNRKRPNAVDFSEELPYHHEPVDIEVTVNSKSELDDHLFVAFSFCAASTALPVPWKKSK